MHAYLWRCSTYEFVSSAATAPGYGMSRSQGGGPCPGGNRAAYATKAAAAELPHVGFGRLGGSCVPGGSLGLVVLGELGGGISSGASGELDGEGSGDGGVG